MTDTAEITAAGVAPTGSLAARLAEARAVKRRQRSIRAAGDGLAAMGRDGPQHLSGAGVAPEPMAVVTRAQEAALSTVPADDTAPERAMGGAMQRADIGPAQNADSGPEEGCQFDGATLLAALELARVEVESLRAQAAHVRNELASARRRAAREREESSRFAHSDTIDAMLPLVDDLERALANVPERLRDEPWVAGVAMIGESVQAMLARQGVERIAPLHALFDPREHEAVSRLEAAEVADNTVVEVFRSGYKLNGRVLRPAQVRVAMGKEA